MGEYADLYYREEVKKKFGFDPGTMYEDNRDYVRPKANRPKCPKCGKKFMQPKAVYDHMKDKHGDVPEAP